MNYLSLRTLFVRQPLLFEGGRRRSNNTLPGTERERKRDYIKHFAVQAFTLINKKLNMDKQYFDIIDYVVFGAMLVLSALIGVYFAFFAKVKQNTTSQYLMGGKTMGIFPVSMSLIAR